MAKNRAPQDACPWPHQNDSNVIASRPFLTKMLEILMTIISGILVKKGREAMTFSQVFGMSKIRHFRHAENPDFPGRKNLASFHNPSLVPESGSKWPFWPEFLRQTGIGSKSAHLCTKNVHFDRLAYKFSQICIQMYQNCAPNGQDANFGFQNWPFWPKWPRSLLSRRMHDQTAILGSKCVHFGQKYTP